jgi:hypothetical protein
VSDDPPKKSGAPWWRESLDRTLVLRRPAFTGFGLLGGAALGLGGGCYDYELNRDEADVSQRLDEIDQSVDAVALQRAQGWNVGHPELPVMIPNASALDVDGTTAWQGVKESLTARLVPAQDAWRPYYSPTLFQSLSGPGNADLRAAITPMDSPSMRAAFARAQAIGSLFEEAGWPADVAIVLDLPGADSVAAAAALADHFDPVFTFANWPHPLGVVPSHQTLAATLFFAPRFERARTTRALPAPPVFVLDADRLAPYRDEDSQFDNRYVARLPTAEVLRSWGVHHVLYVTETDAQLESDDLNDAFVVFDGEGVDVKMLALDDFEESDETPPVDLDYWFFVPSPRGHWYYGGGVSAHLCFWNNYGWHKLARPISIGPPLGMRARVPHGFRYAPRPRATLFTDPAGPRNFARAGGVPHANGEHFGHIAVRTSRSDGAITGVRPGRSGSFGRFHGSFGSFGG